MYIFLFVFKNNIDSIYQSACELYNRFLRVHPFPVLVVSHCHRRIFSDCNPCYFNQQTPEYGVAKNRNTTNRILVTDGVAYGNQANKGHQIPGITKPENIVNLYRQDSSSYNPYFRNRCQQRYESLKRLFP